MLVAYEFNWREVLINFPVRGVIYFDAIEMISGQQENQSGAIYSPNLIYGHGLVKAHLKAESLNWAGSVIDQTVIDQIKGEVDIQDFFTPFAKTYHVPYKEHEKNTKEEFALNIIKGKLNDETFEKYKNDIVRTFSLDNKPIDKPRVQEILENTITFLETFRK